MNHRFAHKCRPQFRAGAFLLILMSTLWLSPANAVETRIEGPIRQDRGWDTESSPYRLTGTVTVEQGASLTVSPGVVVRFDKGSQLIIKGRFAANQTRFDGMEDLHNREALVFQSGSRGHLVFCVIQNLALQLRTRDAEVKNNVIANRNGSGITVGKGVHPTIRWNDFQGNSYYALYKEGRDVIKAPNNFWGAPDGPSGAGPGSGNAVNDPVDFRPFQATDIGEHIYLVGRQLDHTAIGPGGRLSLTYSMTNLNSYSHGVILGATIYTDPENPIHSQPHDRTVTVEPGSHRFTRAFAIPPNASEGQYDVLWGVMKTDLSAYYALEKDQGVLRVGSVPSPPLPASPGPGWVPLKTSPF